MGPTRKTGTSPNRFSGYPMIHIRTITPFPTLSHLACCLVCIMQSLWRPEDELRMRTLAPKGLNHPKSSMFQRLHVAELPKLDPGRATGATLSVELPYHRLATLPLVHCSKTLKTQKIWLWKDHVPVGKHHKSHVSSGIKAGAPGRFPKIISRI